jgi:C1A family cysteine protease
MIHDYPKVSKTGISSSSKQDIPSDYTSGSTAIGSPWKPKAKRQQTTSVMAEKIPSLCIDPFDSQSLIDLTAGDLPNFNLVDGTVRVATDPAWPFILLKGYNRDTFFYAPRWGRIAKNPDTNEPAFIITKKVRNNPDGSKTTIGGVLSFMVELVTELPDDPTRQKWSDFIKTLHNLQPGSGAFNFQPLRLTAGKMNVFGLDRYALPGQDLQLHNVDVGAADSIGFAVDLTPDGADHFAAMVGAKPNPFPPQIAIRFSFKYQYMVPQCDIQAHGFKKKTFDYFSVNAKARASYFGLVNGSFDYSRTRADMKSIGGLDVQVVGNPPQGVDLQKLLDSVFDRFVKMEVGQWIQPEVKPVEAAEPGGFFGGASVAMKSMSFSDNAQFDEHLSFTGISEDVFDISFNFEQQVGDFDPKKHVFIEEDDVKLPFKLAIGNCDKVKMVVPSASYTTSTGPRVVTTNTVMGKDGGLSEGIIQFTFPDRPTSAQVNLVVEFEAPYGQGYTFKQSQPVSDTGAAFLLNPDQFVQRTSIFFINAATTTDLTSKLLFKWEWNPPQSGDTPRPKISGFSLIAPAQDGNSNNLPTYDINFPYQPDDYKGEATPKIQYKVQGLTGEWKNRTASGTISIGETSLAFDWDNVTSIGETLAIPTLLTQFGLTDPNRSQRLTSQYGRFMTPSAKSSAGGGGGMNIGGGGDGKNHTYSLGYVISEKEKEAGFTSLVTRETFAKAVQVQRLALEPSLKSAAYPASYDLRNVNGQNFITAIKDQGYCGSCVAFGVCAAMEGTIQVRQNDPSLNPSFSEADLFYCLGGKHGRTCGNSIGSPPSTEPNGGWMVPEALDEVQSTGVVEESFYPYTSPASPFDSTLACDLPSGWEDDKTKIDSWTVLSSVDDMKAWISSGKGPLIAAFTVYQDFMDYFQNNNSPDAIYRKGENPGQLKGGHCICVIGYSDDDQCWICKNHWGAYWAASGFFKIGYAEVGIDSYMWGVNIS